VLVDEDAVVHVEAGFGRKLDARLHPDADDREVALDHASVAGADTFDSLIALERLDSGSHQHLDAVVGVDVAVDGTHLSAHHALEGNRGRLYDRDVEPALAG
jgi:hypothetical protein